MFNQRWSAVLAVFFLAILAWYLLYSEQLVRAFRAETATITRMYSEVQRGLADPNVAGPEQALYRLQTIVVGSGVPLVLTGPGDTVLSAVNLPFDFDLGSAEGQARVGEYARTLDARRAPVGDPGVQLVHFGDPPDLQRLRWIPWFQVAGLLLTLVTGWLVIRAQREAATDRAWTAMARELAHQLGTPISSLKGWLEVLALKDTDRPAPVDEREIAAEIGTDVERLERVSRRFELIGRRTPLTPLRIEEVLRATERYLAARIPRRSPEIVLRLILEPELPPIQGNEVLLTWALENVVKNALDALAGRGGTITMRAFPAAPGWVTLQIQDTGPGVDPAIRETLFEPGATTKSDGWGVGLSLARRIVERIHGGRIELLESGSTGSTFQLRLPAHRADSESLASR